LPDVQHCCVTFANPESCPGQLGSCWISQDSASNLALTACMNAPSNTHRNAL
jgi:hypothetical protein